FDRVRPGGLEEAENVRGLFAFGPEHLASVGREPRKQNAIGGIIRKVSEAPHARAVSRHDPDVAVAPKARERVSGGSLVLAFFRKEQEVLATGVPIRGTLMAIRQIRMVDGEWLLIPSVFV